MAGYFLCQFNNSPGAKALVSCISAIGIFITLAPYPYLALLFIDLLFCYYFCLIFHQKAGLLIFLHPLILLIASQLFSQSFIELGDGPAYLSISKEYISGVDNSNLLDVYYTHGFYAFLRHYSLGMLPIILIPDYFFNTTDSTVYYVWQGVFHLILCVYISALAKSWQALQDNHLFSITIFSAISPSFFDLGVGPTRHIVTFASILLAFFVYTALKKKVTAARVLIFCLAIALISISKILLLIPFLFFILFDQVILSNNAWGTIKISIILMVSTLGIVTITLLFGTIMEYQEISQEGASTFSWIAQVPILGWVAKYTYAILTPFPWAESNQFISTIYGGNWFLFIMHIFSSLTGVYLVFVVLVHFKQIFSAQDELKYLVAFATIMSFSIIKGATGFHTYILIYFPFLAPLLLYRRFKIPIVFLLYFIGSIEIFIYIIKLFKHL